MILFIKLLIAHVIGDFIIQTKSTIRDKQKKKEKSRSLYLHILWHGLLSLIIITSTSYWLGICIIMISHLIIDLWKLYSQNEANKRIVFITDQLLHILVIPAVSEYYISWIPDLLKEINPNKIFLFVLTILLTTIVSSHIIKVIISRWQPENEDEDKDSLSEAGSYIGILERLFVLGFLISNNLKGIGFLLAAKSVFRFGDLKDSVDRKLTEYILIGTLLSFGFAIIIGAKCPI